MTMCEEDLALEREHDEAVERFLREEADDFASNFPADYDPPPAED